MPWLSCSMCAFSRRSFSWRTAAWLCDWDELASDFVFAVDNFTWSWATNVTKHAFHERQHERRCDSLMVHHHHHHHYQSSSSPPPSSPPPSSSSHCWLAPLDCVVPNVANSFHSQRSWVILSASVSEFVVLEPCDTRTSWQSFPTLQRKHKQNLLSIYVVVHSCCMLEEREMPGLDGWGGKWLAGALLNFCIGNKRSK